MNKPFFWKSRGAWYVVSGRSQVRLHENEAEVYQVWQEMQAAGASNANSSFAAIAESFLGWIVGRVMPKTYRSQ